MALVRSDIRTRADRSDPLLARRQQRADGGLDVEYALTSSLTLTGTINPDFGQVEVDPAVVNLSDFETFYPEKRPFFRSGSRDRRRVVRHAASKTIVALYSVHLRSHVAEELRSQIASDGGGGAEKRPPAKVDQAMPMLEERATVRPDGICQSQFGPPKTGTFS